MIARVRLWAKQFIFLLNDFLAVIMFLLNGRRPRGRLTILCYHRIQSGLPKAAPFDPYNVDPSDFAKQIASIPSIRGLSVVSARDVAAWIEAGGTPEGSYLLLTFDDGWRNSIRAASLVSARGLSGVFFVPTAYVGSRLLQFSAFDVWCSAQPDANPSWYTPLTVNDCLRLRELGMEVQPHGHSHRSLGNLAVEEMEEDINLSLDFVKRVIGSEVLSFSYPYGSSNHSDVTKQVADFLRRSGVRFALTTDAGANRLDRLKQEAFRLKRIPVRAHDKGIFFEAKAAGYCGLLPGLKEVCHNITKRIKATP